MLGFKVLYIPFNMRSDISILEFCNDDDINSILEQPYQILRNGINNKFIVKSFNSKYNDDLEYNYRGTLLYNINNKSDKTYIYGDIIIIAVDKKGRNMNVSVDVNQIKLI